MVEEVVVVVVVKVVVVVVVGVGGCSHVLEGKVEGGLVSVFPLQHGVSAGSAAVTWEAPPGAAYRTTHGHRSTVRQLALVAGIVLAAHARTHTPCPKVTAHQKTTATSFLGRPYFIDPYPNQIGSFFSYI